MGRNDTNKAVQAVVAQLSKEDQAKVKAVYDEIFAIILKNGEAGTLAISLVGSELMGDD